LSESESETESVVKVEGARVPTHSANKRNTDYDWFIFLGVALLSPFTNVWPIYAIAIVRWISIHCILSLHYMFVDKDNYLNKLSQKQLQREKEDYITGYFLHMYVQAGLQIVFPSMFFSDVSELSQCALEAFICHVALVEPIYYAVHRWLHVPVQMKSMHGFHHLSINTLPTTALVQNFQEHFVYIATFGPAFFLPFLVQGRQHWMAIGGYLIAFDIINTFGHTNLKLRHWLWTGKYSPLRYLFYTPEFHLGHHAYFNANFTLFMPIWDYLFGTAREYRKKDTPMLPAKQQDFVFIGHNGGLGHFLTIPELCFYNVYNDYKMYLPLKVEIFVMHAICLMTRLFLSFYSCSRYCIANEYVGRIICLLRTPYDYMTPSRYDDMNKEMIALMRREHKRHGTRYFGLGNLNKMKQLNDGGIDIANMIQQDPYLCDKKIRVWTGDTMTVASVYHQIADIPNLKTLYYIGAGGKVGTAVCEMLVKHRPDLKIRIFSRHHALDHHANITYSSDLSEMADYEVVLAGKILCPKLYRKSLVNQKVVKTRFILDYTVPAMPIPCLNERPEHIQHIRIGMLYTKSPNNPFLRGHYDLCMSHKENHIVPCHFGCILNTIQGRETNEVGDIDLKQVERLWKMTQARGFQNLSIDFSQED
jgi:sterol desaturase/sphingolipid hydroxylase (fatty acid hydroxylase superfamily)